MKALLSALSLLITLGLTGCATETSKTLPVATVEAAKTPYSGTKTAVILGQIDNRSSFMRGIFSDGVDRLGSQAKTILMTHLQQSNRFNVMDRANMAETAKEAVYNKKAQTIKGARYIVAGDVTEFGRKEVGDQQLFGLLGRGKTQVAIAKVSINVIEVATSEVVYSTQGYGEYSLSTREIAGFGGAAGYDATLNGKVLDLAIRDAVNHLTGAMDSGAWLPKK